MDNQLVKSFNIQEYIEKKDFLFEQISALMLQIKEIDKVCSQNNLGSNLCEISEDIRGMWMSDNGISPEHSKTKKSMDAVGWANLMDKSGMRSVMTHAQIREFDENIRRRKMPPLTLENAALTFKGLFEDKDKLLEDAVVAIFQRLSWDYKTNSPMLFQEKIITSVGKGYYQNYDTLDDLIRFACLVNKIPHQDHSNNFFAYWNSKDKDPEKFYWAKLFDFKIYKNGNCHIKIKDQNVIDKLNYIIAKRYPGALPHRK